MNILLTSAGRRTYMVDYFKKALGEEGLVFASNSVMSPALMHADQSFITPMIYDAEYIPFLIGKIREHGIGLVVSLFDIDLPVLAAHRQEIEEAGAVLAVSDSGALKECNDKYLMSLKLQRSGIATPETELAIEQMKLKFASCMVDWPVIVKPRFGMGSIGVMRAYDKAELKALYGICRREIENSYLRFESQSIKEDVVLVQESIEGNEYGLDVVNDLQAEYVTTIVRKKLGMRSGETDEALILGPEDPEYAVLAALGKKISANFRHRGLMDVDVMMNPHLMTPYVIDMNARFGGGYPFSHTAGADIPRAYIAWAKGEEAPESCFAVKYGTHAYKDIALDIY